MTFFANKQMSPSVAREIYTMAKKISSNAKWFATNKNRLAEWASLSSF
jgi:hypothetical protein